MQILFSGNLSILASLSLSLAQLSPSSYLLLFLFCDLPEKLRLRFQRFQLSYLSFSFVRNGPIHLILVPVHNGQSKEDIWELKSTQCIPWKMHKLVNYLELPIYVLSIVKTQTQPTALFNRVWGWTRFLQKVKTEPDEFEDEDKKPLEDIVEGERFNTYDVEKVKTQHELQIWFQLLQHQKH